MAARFSAGSLKKTAMGCMVLDHAAVILLDGFGWFPGPTGEILYLAMRLLGRMAFPLFAFLLVEGFLYTKDWKRYGARLGVLAMVSEIPYNLLLGGTIWNPEGQNTVWTLLLGLLAMKAMETVERWGEDPAIKPAFRLGIAVSFALAAQVFRVDYGFFGILFLAALYAFRYQPPMRMLAGVALLPFSCEDFTGAVSCIAFFFINRYNGEKGKRPGRWSYWFYPLHILGLYGLGELINGIHF